MAPIPIALVKVAAAVVTGIVGAKLLDDEKQRKVLLQRAFLNFHDNIKHEQFGERDLLRKRRELLLTELAIYLPAHIRLRAFDQGSYAMQTGVKPLRGEFDIDIGLVLDCDSSWFSDSVQAKQMVRDALDRGSRRVRVRRSCVTVDYSKAGFGDYHVDIAVYVPESDKGLLLAKGREHSESHLRAWEVAEPERLTALLVRGKYAGEELSQFRRCIRYLKRWKQVSFSSPMPYSIALTVAAYHWFEPRQGFFGNAPNDLEALLYLVRKMDSEFWNGRLKINLPVAPKTDLAALMTDKQMQDFRGKLRKLAKALETARDENDDEIALNILRYEFGEAFG